MSKLKTESEKSRLLRHMNLEREKFMVGQEIRERQQRRSRGVTPAEGMVLNALFSLVSRGRFPALLKKPVQAIALSWLKGRFGRLVDSSLGKGKPKIKSVPFADDIGDASDEAAAAMASLESFQIQAVTDLRRICNQLNAAIQEGHTAEIETLSVALKAQIAETRIALEDAAAASQTPVDRAVAWTRTSVRAKPWAAVGTGAGAGYAVGMAVALWKRWQAKRAARRDFELFYKQTGPRHRKPRRA